MRIKLQRATIGAQNGVSPELNIEAKGRVLRIVWPCSPKAEFRLIRNPQIEKRPTIGCEGVYTREDNLVLRGGLCPFFCRLMEYNLSVSASQSGGNKEAETLGEAPLYFAAGHAKV